MDTRPRHDGNVGSSDEFERAQGVRYLRLEPCISRHHCDAQNFGLRRLDQHQDRLLIGAARAGCILVDDDLALFLSPMPQGHASTIAVKTQTRPNFIVHLRMVIYAKTCRTSSGWTQAGYAASTACLLVPDRRPISRSKNRGESTSSATLAFGTNLSRKTGDVLVLARVGAEPRIGMFMSCLFFRSRLTFQVAGAAGCNRGFRPRSVRRWFQHRRNILSMSGVTDREILPRPVNRACSVQPEIPARDCD